ncbi:serine hydrolase family protein [Mesorhizobium intechi]|uniref:RBBP9/YdeN family alpha/beta hydrolase n=1 Tax=Mesorhizobium intechi TaxID=537601 RepID=UPI000CB56E17|nr:alpha/beta hydrolase [Mesorhizobium intechi]TSE08960.1 serine hydrolase family protein [Mesorhizobium intechi]
MTHFIILPGSGGSGPAHWQSRWEDANPAMRRFRPSSWDLPDFTDWLAALEAAVVAAPEPPVLVAHSLSCLLIAHWQTVSQRPVTAALLVGVPDPASAVFPRYGMAFAGIPQGKLRFASLVVTSTDDPYGSQQYAEARAKQWGSRFAVIGPFGHINAESGLGDWPEGLELLDALVCEA